MKVVNNKYAFATLLVLGFAFVVSNVFAQQKDLKIEDDDFRWYLLRQNGYEGAELYDGTTIIPLSREYTWIVYYTTSDGWFGVKKNMKEGACDKEGKEIVPPKYDDVHYYKADGFEYYTIKLKGKAGVLDKEGRELLAPKKYDYVSYKNAEGFDHFLVGKNNRMGLCDMNGNEIIKPKYDMYSVYYDTDDGYIHVRLDGKCGAFDKEGKQLVPPQYNYLQYSSNDSFEYMDDTGHLVSLGVSLMSGNSIQVDAQGRKLHTQSNGYKWYEVESDGSVGVLSTKGDTIVPLTKAYDSVYYQKNNGGWFIVKKNGKVGVYNKMGREILSPAKYDYVKSEKHPNFLCFKVKQDGRWGVCDSNGKEIIKPTYDNVQYEDNNFFMVESDKKWGVIDINGNVIISPKYQSVDYRYKRYFEVGQDGLKGVCDKNGREVVPPQFKVIKYQSDLFWYKNDAGTWIPLEITLDGNVTFMHEKDGFRWRKVEKDSLCAAQDMNGSFLISFGKEYDGIWYNENKGGWFSVTKNGKMGACQKDGCERISPYTYDIVYYCNDGGHEYYVVGIGNAYGICNKFGREIIGPKYDVVFYMENEQYYAIQLNGKMGACDLNGKEIIKPNYESLIYSSDVFKYQDPSGNWVSTGITLAKDGGASYASSSYSTNSSSSNSSNNNDSKMTRKEKVETVFQVLGAVANAIQQSNNTAVQHNNNSAVQPAYTNGDNNVNYNNSTSHTKSKTICAQCHGTGRCSYCGGTHVRTNQFSHEKVECVWCNKNGDCHWCNGKGVIE